MNEKNSEYCKADLHAYLRTFSGTRNDDFDNVVNIAESRLGKGGIVSLTDCEDDRYERTIGLFGYRRDYFGSAVYVLDKDIWVVKSQAVNAKAGEKDAQFLVLGLKSDRSVKSSYYPERGGLKPLEDALKQARDENGICIMSNPFGMLGVGHYVMKNEKLLDYFDGIVTYSGVLGEEENKNAWDFYRDLKRQDAGIGELAVSDAHSIKDIGKSYTLLPRLNREEIKNSDDIVARLRGFIKNSPAPVFGEDALHCSSSGTLSHKAKIALFRLSRGLKAKGFEKWLENSTL